MFRFTPLVRNLLLLNVIIAFVDVMLLNAKLSDLAGLRPFTSSEFLPFQLLTYMFVHSPLSIEPFHLIGNMIALAVFGPWLERQWGSNRFFIFYLATGLGAGLIHSGVTTYQTYEHQQAIIQYAKEQTPENYADYLGDYVNKYIDRYGISKPNFNDKLYMYAIECQKLLNDFSENPNNEKIKSNVQTQMNSFYNAYADQVVVGASGAVFGILIAVFFLFPNVQIFLLFPPIPLKVKYLVGFYMVYELYVGLGGQGELDNVAHYAHLGGALVGFILVKMWSKINFNG